MLCSLCGIAASFIHVPVSTVLWGFLLDGDSSNFIDYVFVITSRVTDGFDHSYLIGMSFLSCKVAIRRLDSPLVPYLTDIYSSVPSSLLIYFRKSCLLQSSIIAHAAFAHPFDGQLTVCQYWQCRGARQFALWRSLAVSPQWNLDLFSLLVIFVMDLPRFETCLTSGYLHWWGCLLWIWNQSDHAVKFHFLPSLCLSCLLPLLTLPAKR